MQKTSKIFVIFSYLYLILPILIFVITWCNPIFASLGFILISFGAYFLYKNSAKLWIPSSKKEWLLLILGLILALAWVCSSGIGALVFQNPDHDCRNFIFETLVSNNWPVMLDYKDNHLMLSYYIGFWLPSAFIAKIFGNNIQLGYYFQILWATVGIFLVFYYLLSFFEKKNLLQIMIFIFFSGLDILGAKFVGYPTNSVSHLEWWYPEYQFSSFTTQLYWVFNQAIPAWLITLMILKESNNKNILFIYSTAFLSATLPAIGMFPIIVYCLFKNFSKENSFKFDVDYIVSFLKSCFSYQNVLCLFFIILMTFCYLTGNISGSQRAVSEFDIFEILKFLLYFLLLEVGVYMLLIWKFNKKEPLFYIALFLFLIYPFIKIGTSNDFCMRATIPALVVLFLLIVKTLFSDEILKYKKLCITLVICLLFGAVTPIHEMTRTFVYTQLGMKKIKPTFSDAAMMNFFSYKDKNYFYKYFGRKS